jgi:hypothetical protein
VEIPQDTASLRHGRQLGNNHKLTVRIRHILNQQFHIKPGARHARTPECHDQMQDPVGNPGCPEIVCPESQVRRKLAAKREHENGNSVRVVVGDSRHLSFWPDGTGLEWHRNLEIVVPLLVNLACGIDTAVEKGCKVHRLCRVDGD